MSDNHLTILVVEPGKPPYLRQIPDTLQAMQEIVGGDIDATYPYEDPVALIFNSERQVCWPAAKPPPPAGKRGSV